MKQPFTAQAVTLYAEKETPAFAATMEASDDGRAWRSVGRITPSAAVTLTEALLHATPRIDGWALKAEYDTTRGAVGTRAADPGARFAIDPARIIDVTGKVDASGTLDWTPSPGVWTILRFGHTPTGKLNVVASRPHPREGRFRRGGAGRPRLRHGGDRQLRGGATELDGRPAGRFQAPQRL